MRKIILQLTLLSLVLSIPAIGQNVEPLGKPRQHNYLINLDDATLDMEAKLVTVFALDDRASLSSNPHFEAMWNLVKLGASLEALLQGMDEPINDIDLGKKFGQNGYNKTVMMVLLRYGFGESSDLKLQTHFLEMGLSSGFYKEGGGGLHWHLDYKVNVFKTEYGAGGKSLTKAFDHEVFAGARLGFDWSFGRSEGEAGFFNHLSDEIKRIAEENEFTASQLIQLEELAETSSVLLPEDVGGGAFHVGPIIGARISKRLLPNTRAYLAATGFYDVMDLASSTSGQENVRSQHQVSVELGMSFTIGADGGRISTTNSFF